MWLCYLLPPKEMQNLTNSMIVRCTTNIASYASRQFTGIRYSYRATLLSPPDVFDLNGILDGRRIAPLQCNRGWRASGAAELEWNPQTRIRKKQLTLTLQQHFTLNMQPHVDVHDASDIRILRCRQPPAAP